MSEGSDIPCHVDCLLAIERANAVTVRRELSITAEKAVNEAPTDSHLCHKCRHIIRSSFIIQALLSQSTGESASGIIERGKEVFEHYDEFQGLIKSAAKGCHLCSLLYGSSHYYPEFPYVCVIRPLQLSQFYCELEIKPKVLDKDRNESIGYLKFHVNVPQIRNRIRKLQTVGTDSDQSFSCASTWLKGCLTDHKLCETHMRDENFRPQRLLKVSITGAGILVQLLVTKEIPREVRIQYLTLSYCWGQGDHLRLTKATEETFAEGVPLEDMPKTLLDAVVITARLHYEHLWIDALCIIQDSEQDTKDNILSMGEVYRNSIFTIAALAARGSHEGCFVRRNPLARDEYRVREDSPYTFSHLFEPIGPDTRDPQLAPPLQKRAWVIQERALSPRTLYYGSEMIFWECIQSKASEYEPIMQDLWYAGGQDLKDRSPGVIFHSGMKSVFKLLLDRCKDGTYCDWISYWRKLVRDYTVCQMTKESDKWAAIAGLATEVELVARDESFHGLWKNRLCRELLWYADRPGRRLGTEKPGGQEVKAPSWSWTSVDAIIEWWTEYEKESSNVKWEAVVSVTPTSLESIHPKNRIVLKVPPNLRFSQIFPVFGGDSLTDDLWTTLAPVEDKKPNMSYLHWYPDTKDTFHTPIKHTLQLVSYIVRGWRHLDSVWSPFERMQFEGLVVTPTDESHTSWSRLGYYRASWDPKDFESSQTLPLYMGSSEESELVYTTLT